MSRRNGSIVLPDNTQSRIALIVTNSMPNPYRPRLSEESEYRLNDIERRTAACYAEVEETVFKLRKMAKILNEEID